MRTVLARGFLAFLLVSAPAWGREPVRARHGMVVSEQPFATQAGVQVLNKGGNAVDAAVAVAFALAVVHPSAGNLGGGGFMLVRLANGTTSFIDFREKAPLGASRNMYIGGDGKPTQDSVQGWRASGVPGTVRGLGYAHKKWGKQKWAADIEPAVQLAQAGFTLSARGARGLNRSRRLGLDETSKRIFQAKTWEQDDRIAQPELAHTLTRIARDGADEFYTGETAHIFAEEMAKHGGLITIDDLKGYQAVERKPLEGTYNGYGVITAPPPSSGGIGILQMLKMLEGSGYQKPGWGSAATIHTVAEVMRRYYADRSEWLGDPDFFKVPVSRLLDPAYIAKRRASIDPEHASASAEIKPGTFNGHESTETTHLSVVDAEGNAVSMTYTLNGGYGSGVTVPRLGFLLNNEMDDFAVEPGKPNLLFGLVQGEGNAIAPGKRPLSSMTPTILTRDGKLFMVLGGPGGGRIITSVLQTILNVVDFNCNVQDAIDRPREHHQWQPDKISLEPGFSPDTIALLEKRGHKVEVTGPESLIEAIVVGKDGWLEGGADGRSDALAQGY